MSGGDAVLCPVPCPVLPDHTSGHWEKVSVGKQVGLVRVTLVYLFGFVPESRTWSLSRIVLVCLWVHEGLNVPQS